MGRERQIDCVLIFSYMAVEGSSSFIASAKTLSYALPDDYLYDEVHNSKIMSYRHLNQGSLLL